MKKKVLALILSMVLMLSPGAPALAAGGFTDVPDYEWYAGAVTYCASHNLVAGMGEGYFAPFGTVTRAMTITVIYRLMGSPSVHGESGFTDIAADWYRASTLWGSRTGIAAGYDDGRFGPDDPVTREQLAVFFWRVAGSPEAEEKNSFSDESDISDFAQEAVFWAREVGVINGMPDGSFNPKGSANRAQLSMVLMNFAEKVSVNPIILSEIDVMCAPGGIQLTRDGELIITDTYYKKVWLVREGVSTVYAGGDSVEDLYGQPMGGYNDAKADESLFSYPWSITPFLEGWAVSDADNNVVRYVTAGAVQTVNARTNENLPMTKMGVAFDHPTGLATDENGNLYVADSHAGAVRKIAPNGVATTYVNNLNEPMGLCWAEGKLYIAETGAHRILRVKNAGQTEVIAGTGEEGFVNGPVETARFSSPQALTIGEDGTIFVADTVNGAVRRIRNGTVDTMILLDSPQMASFPVSPMGLLVWGNRLYICDSFSRKVFTIPLN